MAVKLRGFKPGSLRHRVTIEKPPETDTDYGGHSGNWTEVSKAWARIEPVSGREQFFGDQTTPLTTHQITMRDNPDVTAERRLVFRSRNFYIKSIRRVEEALRGYIVVQAVEE